MVVEQVRFLTLPEVAKMLGLTNQRIYQMDDELRPVFQARGSKQKTRMYDPEVVRAARAVRVEPTCYPDGLKAWWRCQTNTWRKAGEDNALSFEKFVALSLQQCHHCGALPSLRKVSSGGVDYEIRANGIDVLDESRGLVPGNVVTCCYRCEALRTVMTCEEIVEYSQRVVNWKTGRGGPGLKWLF